MAYTLVVVKDSRKLREARLAREKIEAEEAAKSKADGSLEKLNPKVETEEVIVGKPTGCKGLFDITNIIQGVKAVLKPRENHKRTLLLLTILVFELEIFIIVSTLAFITLTA